MVKAEGSHFVYEDGTKYIPFGTTVYALASQEDALVDQTIETLKHAPFNKIRMCVFPKDYDYNKNEPPYYAFEKDAAGNWDVNSPCIPFWHRFEQILDRINRIGMEIDLILFHPYDRWGFSKLSQKDNLAYLDYLLRRLSARPGIWWSLANEYDLNLKYKSFADWEEIEEYVADNDPYGHLISNHNCICHWDYGRKNITHVSVQTKALTEIPRWIRKFGKPVMIDECCYEGDVPQFWGSISAREMTNRFWRAFASGGFCTHGETFLSEDEILWWAKGGKLKGDSPRHIAFLKEIAYELPGALVPDKRFGEIMEQVPEDNIEEAMQEMTAGMPDAFKEMFPGFVKSIHRMDPIEKVLHGSYEHEWKSRYEEEAYVQFCDLQCYKKQTMQLPKDKTYRIEIIDTWEMTRTVVNEHASGETEIPLPGKEGIAIIAVRV